MDEDWGRLTARGGAEVEHYLQDLLREIAEKLDHVLPADQYRAVLLIGGYGRGEGGVEWRDGRERPHNNLDFLIITHHGAEQALKQRADAVLQPIAEREGLGLDVGVVSERTLRHSPCLVMWYDMRYGHKRLLGRPEALDILARFTVERIEPWDVRNLLVNRGTLLLINTLLLERRPLSEADRRTIVKHAVKGIIGYGDALLFSQGLYHWSYQEKQRRMQKLCDRFGAFCTLYDQAIEFRFRPDYGAFPGLPVAEWMTGLWPELEPVHLRFEAFRLHCEDLQWPMYFDAAMRHAWWEQSWSWRAWARKAWRMRESMPGVDAPWLVRLGMRASGMRGVLPVLFPAVAYAGMDDTYLQRARQLLQAPDLRPENMRRAYLRAWGRYGDINFAQSLQRMGLSLEFVS